MSVEMLARAILNPSSQTLLISARQDTANQALNYVYRLFDSEDGGSRLVERTKDSCKLDNEAEIICLPANESAARGYAATHVYLDEFAHMPFAGEIYEAVAPTVARGGDLCIVSTPRGQSGRFYEIWRDARKGENEYRRLRIHWTECPAYNPLGAGMVWNGNATKMRELGEKSAWYRANRGQYSDMEWQRQFECDFVASVDLLFDQKALGRLHRKLRKPISVEGGLRIYLQPVKNKRYILAADPGTGLTHGDYSVCIVLDNETGEEAAMLRGRWSPSEFANRIWDLRQRGYDGVIVPERTGIGIALCEHLMALDPRQIYRDKEDKRVGWRTTGRSKPMMLASLQDAIRKEDFQPNSPEFYNEAEVFENGSAPQGEHDDCIMAAAIAWEVRKGVPKMDGIILPQSWAGGERYGQQVGITGY
jgi:hypothetical protein